ncbi:MAG: type II secretion system GspH family protein [bacterium]|nr:type II secretion system GspH family protein [bacterium]
MIIKRKGFTLLETLVSMALFSAVLVIVFNAFLNMQKAAFKTQGKNDANSQIIHMYNSVDGEISKTNIKLFRCYRSGKSPYLSEKRWFAFPVTGSRTGTEMQKNTICSSYGEEGGIGYSRVRLFFVNYKPGCCGGFNSCPHKSLCMVELPLCKSGSMVPGHSCGSCGVPYDYTTTRKCISAMFDGGDRISDFMNKGASYCHNVQNNILDLTIDSPLFNSSESQLLYLNFTGSFFRTEEAEKFHFRPQGVNLISPSGETLKYIEKISWTSIPANIK